MALLRYIIDTRKSALKPLTSAEYQQNLLDDREKAKLAFEKAWATRNFEIEMYWKRATYFWAFIASTLIGYFALVNSSNYLMADPYDHVEVYFVICIGFVLATAWFLTNVGSKAWQRHWEVHVDMLEDLFTGPLYKTVFPRKTFSVSKINEIVSFSFVIVWILIGVKYFIDKDLINFSSFRINWLVVFATSGAALAVVSMIFGHGRGRFSDREVLMYRRSMTYKYFPAEPTLASEQTDISGS
ncbi:MAG TPA: hypothetical protein VHB46_01780 [Burkholderiales bacterium]|nr:hypothetical protein [Burkholderiales bacterium]